MNDPATESPNAGRTGVDPRLAEAWDLFYAYCFTVISGCPAVRRLSDVDREDCVQEVMMEIADKFTEPPEVDRDRLAGWLRVVSRNKAADIVRKRYRKPEVLFDDGTGGALLDDKAGGGEGLPDGEMLSLVWEALVSMDQKVSVTSYLVFYLRTIEGWSIPEVSDLFQLSHEQTRARLHRVKQKFGSILKTKGRGRGHARPS
jgi:RNA polymerase sigma factor (sigma-70 family)